MGVGTGSDGLLHWKLQGNEIMVEKEGMGIDKGNDICGKGASLC